MLKIVDIIQQHFLENDPITTYLIPALKIAAILILSFVILRYSGNWIDRISNIRNVDKKRSETLAKLLKSFIKYAVYLIATLTILINIGLDPTPVLAGAGILGLAIGFGAQNLVRDIITGFFLIFENQLHVGDYVEVNGQITGTVEEIGLRVTKIREWNERLHYLSNGEISRVTNYNREQMRPLVSVTVPYEEDQQKVEQSLNDICQSIAKQYEQYLLEEPSVYGITSLDQNGVHYTVMAVSVPEQYWAIERAIRKAIIYTFQTQNIEISYPKRVLYSAQTDNNVPIPIIEKHRAETREH